MYQRFQVIQLPCQTGRLITTNQMIWQLIGQTQRLIDDLKTLECIQTPDKRSSMNMTVVTNWMTNPPSFLLN
jgi:hypothetical protein